MLLATLTPGARNDYSNIQTRFEPGRSGAAGRRAESSVGMSTSLQHVLDQSTLKHGRGCLKFSVEKIFFFDKNHSLNKMAS